MKTEVREAIERAAAEHGIDPGTALAIAERESGFDPRARSSKTIRGMFQMRGDLRQQHGVGDSDDPYTQAKGWGSFFKGVKADMAGRLGRDPTDAEGYLGHHFGAKRATRMMGMDPATPVDSVFTREEMRLNPHFAKAGTVGALNSSILGDIGKRQAKFGGGFNTESDLSQFGVAAAEPVQAREEAPAAHDLSQFGVPAETYQLSAPAASSAPDLSSFGVPA